MTGHQPEAPAVPSVTRWRKRPVEIKAIQWTGENLADVQAFCGPGYFEAVPPEDRDPDPDMTAQVYDELHGTWVHVYDGQWVIRGVQGELYPCAAVVFAATYEPADGPAGRVPEAEVGEAACPRITVDLNVRVRKHETYSGFEDVTGADPAALHHGDRVLAVEVEDGICSDAIVTGVDPERRLVYLVPDWGAWRDDPAIAGSGGRRRVMDDREPLGRLVRETWVRWAAEQPGRKPSWTVPWEDLDDGQREVDMRIGHAVANYALTENAITWGTSCTSCARVLDSAYAETMRREAAEAKLAEVRQTVTGFLAHYGTSTAPALAVAGDLAHGILQVTDRAAAGEGMQEAPGQLPIPGTEP